MRNPRFGGWRRLPGVALAAALLGAFQLPASAVTLPVTLPAATACARNAKSLPSTDVNTPLTDVLEPCTAPANTNGCPGGV